MDATLEHSTVGKWIGDEFQKISGLVSYTYENGKHRVDTWNVIPGMWCQATHALVLHVFLF